MDRWDVTPGTVPDPSSPFSGTVTVYLWGFLVVFAVALILGGWFSHRPRQGGEDLWSCFVAAILWPLFVCAVLFVVLWGLLSRNRHH